MRTIPGTYQPTERLALIVRPREPFSEWLHAVIRDESLIPARLGSDIYLLGPLEEHDQVAPWLEEHFDHIFTTELNEWYTDDAEWPQHRDYLMFQEWFEVEVVDMVYDVSLIGGVKGIARI